MLLGKLIIVAAIEKGAGREGRRRALLGAEDRNPKMALEAKVRASGAGLCSGPRIGTPSCAPQSTYAAGGAGLRLAPRIGTW